MVALSEDLETQVVSYLLADLDPPVVAVSSSSEAKRYVEQHGCAVAILDTDLSDGTGFDLLADLVRMRFEGGILMISSSADVMQKVRAFDLGASDYLVRPYEPAELIARIKVVLRQSRQHIANVDHSVIRVGAVELDAQNLTVHVAGHRSKRLTPSEMRLLRYLMTHPQRVVRRDELVAQLFGPNSDGISTSIVGVYMRRVRQKVEIDADRPQYIITVRGSGYRFNEAVAREGSHLTPTPPSAR